MLTFLHDVQEYHVFFFRSDESLGSPNSSITGISNGSAGATEKSSLRMDNVNNNNNQNGILVVGGNNTNVNSGSGGLFTLHNNSQHVNNNNSLGIYSGASSLSGDNMSIGSITDIPGIRILSWIEYW